MQPFTKHPGLVAPLDRVNVDTDQMVPKQFLKFLTREGYGRVLFYDWRYQAGEKPNGVPNTVGFPYGFPKAGAYRIFVQMKHGQTIETAAFDACAGSPHTDASGKS